VPRITELYAYVVAEADDDEGVPAFLSLENAWIPLMGADRGRAEQLRYQAQLVADTKGKPVRLLRSTGLVEVEVIRPRRDP
jgi:hypothetical protein